jgi:hypothetical protein
MYSGSENRKVSLRTALESLGFKCVCYDILQGAAGDLGDDTVWESVEADIISGIYFYVFSSFPCKSSSVLRHSPNRRPGPGPLRACEPPAHLWGLPGLQGKDKELVRLGNLHALRSARAASIQISSRRGAALENPEPWPGLPSLFYLEPLDTLLALGARDVDFDQCPFGAESPKGTRIRYYLGSFGTLANFRCQHAKREFQDDNGKKYWAAHRRIAGRKTEDGKWASSAAEAYSDLFNIRLAQDMANAWHSIGEESFGEQHQE